MDAKCGEPKMQRCRTVTRVSMSAVASSTLINGASFASGPGGCNGCGEKDVECGVCVDTGQPTKRRRPVVGLTLILRAALAHDVCAARCGHRVRRARVLELWGPRNAKHVEEQLGVIRTVQLET